MQRTVIAMGMFLSAVCKSWRDEAYIVFQQDAWQQDMIMQPQQCFTLVTNLTQQIWMCLLFAYNSLCISFFMLLNN